MTRQLSRRGEDSVSVSEDLYVYGTLYSHMTPLMDRISGFTDQALTLGPSSYWVRGSLTAAGCCCLRWWERTN